MLLQKMVVILRNVDIISVEEFENDTISVEEFENAYTKRVQILEILTPN